MFLLQLTLIFWKREYPHLNICRPAEDMCGYYFAFSDCHRYLASCKYCQMVESGSNEMETETMDVDGLLENVGNMSLDDIPNVDIQMDSPEAVATPEEKERDQLLLLISKHIRIYQAQRALYQQKVGEAIEDARGGVCFEDRLHIFWLITGRKWSCQGSIMSSWVSHIITVR